MSEYIVDFAAHNVNAAIALCDGVHGKIVRCRDCEFFVRDKLGECCICGHEYTKTRRNQRRCEACIAERPKWSVDRHKEVASR